MKNSLLYFLTILVGFFYLAIPYTCPNYPRGSSGTDGSIYYHAFDVHTTNGIIAAGSCEDKFLCGKDAPSPLIELIEHSTLSHKWTKVIPKSANNRIYKSFEAVKFKPDGS
jgi:hypothetical protein